MRRNQQSFCFLVISLIVLITPIFSQSGRGVITGTVKDSTGAMIPSAEVLVTNQETGVEMKAITTDAGIFRLPYVQPGKYRITISMPGFKSSVRENVEVMIAQTITTDFTLEVGAPSDTVTVSGGTPQLEASTAEIGTSTSELEVHTWPVLVSDGTRQLQTFIFNALPGTTGEEWNGSINGGQGFSHEIMVDGISIGRMDLNGGSMGEFTATMDAVSEFRLQTGAMSAQYGNTGTGITNFGMKSGTNLFHGSAFWLHQNSVLNANTWANNTYGVAKPKTRLNNGGATFGGPIRKDKTFFHFSYEFNRQFNQNLSSSYDSAPTAAMKQGDFSKLLDANFTKNSNSGKVVGKDALGRDVLFGQIYDPITTRQLSSGTWVRDPFPGNIIPANRFSPLTKKFLSPAFALPDPSYPLGERLRQNMLRVGTCCPGLYIDNLSIKVDHVINEGHKLCATYLNNDRYRKRYGSGYRLEGEMPNTPAAGDRIQKTPGNMVRFSEDWVISPTKLNHFAYGYNRFRNANQSAYLNTKDWATELGLVNVPGGATTPSFTFGGANTTLSGSYRAWGDRGTSDAPNGSNIVSDDFTWIKGAHSLRVGGEHRRYYLNTRNANTPPAYTFDSDQTALSNFSTQTGFAFSSFILGAVRNTSAQIIGATEGLRSRVTSLYAQDDWRVRPKLSLNLGVRWDIAGGFTSPSDQMSALDPTKPNPGANNYPGALAFAGACSACTGKSGWADTYYGQFAPRLGFAYAASNKLVIRGGYGINYSPPILDGWFFGFMTGFNGSNNIPQKRGRSGQGNDPAYYWDNPYPKYAGTLPNYDPAQLNDDTIMYYPPDTRKLPMMQNWNFGLQYQLPWDTKVEANYVGNHGSRLEGTDRYSMDQVDPKYLSLGDTLLDSIDDHPEMKKPYADFSGTVAQSLRKFPQYYAVSAHRSGEAYSNYHSAQVTLTKRAGNGLSFLVAYTWSKALATNDDAIGYVYGNQSMYNRRGEYSVTGLNIPHDLKITFIYDLPFGPKGRWARSGVQGAVLGGWTISGIWRYRSGPPLSIYSSANPDIFSALGSYQVYPDVLLPYSQQIIGSKPKISDEVNGVAYLNPKAFRTVPGTPNNNVPTHLGNASRYSPNLRGWMVPSESLSLIKRTPLKLREGSYFELRADAGNLFNRAFWNNPETDIGDEERFGKVFGKNGGGRTIQVGVRISF